MKALIQKILVVCLMVTGVAGNAWGTSGKISGNYNGLTIDGDATIDKGVTVKVTGNLYIKPNSKNGATLTINGILDVEGTIYLQEGSYEERVALVIPVTRYAYGSLDNKGTVKSKNIEIQHGDNTFKSEGTLTILGNLENNGTLKSSTNLTIPSSLTGSGTIDMTGATNPKLTVGSANSTITVKMGNNAQISANSGDLKLGSVIVGANSSIHTAGSLTTTGGTIGNNTSLSIGKDFTNGSTLTVSDALDIPGNFTNNGTVTIEDVPFRVGSYDDNNMAVSDAGGDVVNNGTININTSLASATNGDFGYLVSQNLTNNGTINLNSGYIETKKDLVLNLDSKLNYASGASGVLVYGNMFQDGSGTVDIFVDNAKINLASGAEGVLVVAGTYTDEGTSNDHPWGLDLGESENIEVESGFDLAVVSYDYNGAYGILGLTGITDKWKRNGVFSDKVEELTQKIQEALPIELVYFRAQQEDGNVEFAWQTASELNNDYFTIEYSFNAVDFEELAIVAGSGTTTETVDYQYTEFSAKHTGTVYYRLKQTDYDGEFTYSDMIALTFAEKEFDENISTYVVYPNPATDIISVEGQFEQIAVCDFNGRVLAVASQGENVMNVSNLPSGTYYVKVTMAEGQKLIPFIKR